MGEVLVYVVTDIRVIQPDQTESILPDPDRDLITLVTCTPLGINTERILVTAERITPTPLEDAQTATASLSLAFPWWAVVFGLGVIAVASFVWVTGRNRKSTDFQ